MLGKKKTHFFVRNHFIRNPSSNLRNFKNYPFLIFFFLSLYSRRYISFYISRVENPSYGLWHRKTELSQIVAS